MKNISPQDQVFWYVPQQLAPALTHDASTDVVIIGGGMAGLTAAQCFHEKGSNVIVLEKNFCGAGASGKSSGFITPGSELSLANLMHAYGTHGTKELWDFVVSGVHLIEKNIQTYALACDYKKEDTLVIANSPHMFKNYIVQEYESRSQLGYKSTLYSAEQLTHVLGSSAYYGGIAYQDTFGIKAYEYCQEMKRVLMDKGVKIYEETPVTDVQNNQATTPRGTVKARHIVICVDQFLPTLKKLSRNVYHAQTFITLSAPLDAATIAQIFPHKQYMVWDTDLVYQYFRLTGDNRLILGGASALYTFAKHEIHHSNFISKKLNSYFKRKFPHVNITFEYMWPGLIGISKDLVPIAGPDEQDPSIFYITASTGLPWAAALGRYSAEYIIDNNTRMNTYFSPYRSYPLPNWTQTILGTKLTFALSNYLRVR